MSTLHDYNTGDEICEATPEELAESIAAAHRDGGAGIIKVDGRDCYVVGEDIA